MKQIFIIIIWALYSLNYVSAADKDIVAMVQGQPITKYQLDNRAKLVINTQNITFNSRDDRDEFDKQIIDQLVEEELVKKAAQEFGIELKSEMIDAAIRSLEKQNNFPQNYMVSLLQEHGLSVESYRNKIGYEILRGRIFSMLASDISVTEAEARNHLWNSQQIKPKIHIWVVSSKAQEDSYNSFDQMQKLRHSLMQSDLNKLSITQDTQLVDMVELFDYSKLTPHTKSALKDTNKGSVSKVYQEDNKYKLIVVLEKDFIDEKEISAIKNDLKMQKAEKKYNFFIKGLRNKTDIVIK
ncbi:MAG: SurA N-terminal domain-containing protein [Rickettsiaceae bacterium]|nr:SurA N-terminal domain-containing protein [Rickettsiaceae bacterium]